MWSLLRRLERIIMTITQIFILIGLCLIPLLLLSLLYGIIVEIKYLLTVEEDEGKLK